MCVRNGATSNGMWATRYIKTADSTDGFHELTQWTVFTSLLSGYLSRTNSLSGFLYGGVSILSTPLIAHLLKAGLHDDWQRTLRVPTATGATLCSSSGGAAL